MTYSNHPLTEAARYGDAQAEEQGIEAMIAQQGMDLDALTYVAEQRALRIVIMSTRGAAALKRMAGSGRFENVSLTQEEDAMLEIFKIAYLDGLFIGWSARAIANRTSLD